jgi:hypothetical protein
LPPGPDGGDVSSNRTSALKPVGDPGIRAERKPSSFRPSGAWTARGIFLSAMAGATLLATAIGGAMAWQGSEYLAGSNTVGSIDFEILYTPTGQAVGPNNGVMGNIGMGQVQNVGDYGILLTKHSVELTGLSAPPECTLSMFAAEMLVFGGITDEIRTTEGPQGTFSVRMAAMQDAAPQCNGATISYNVYFTFRATG